MRMSINSGLPSLLLLQNKRVSSDNVNPDETHDVITLSPFTLGGGRCKTILGVEQGLGETLFEMYHFDTVLSYIYYYSIFFPIGKIFRPP